MELRDEFKRDLRNHNYEKAETGLFLPRHKIMIGGIFTHSLNGAGEEHDHNLMTNEGLDHVLDVAMNGGTAATAWYVGIFEGNYTPVAGDTAATFATSATESTAYDQTTRPLWDSAAVASQQVTNSASKAQFTINATKTIYGAFLVSSSTKSGTAGTLLAASRFAAARSVVASDELLITYTLSAADA